MVLEASLDPETCYDSWIKAHFQPCFHCCFVAPQIGVHTGSRWYTTSVNVPQGLQVRSITTLPLWSCLVSLLPHPFNIVCLCLYLFHALQCILFIPEVRQETEACRAILVSDSLIHTPRVAHLPFCISLALIKFDGPCDDNPSPFHFAPYSYILNPRSHPPSPAPTRSTTLAALPCWSTPLPVATLTTCSWPRRTREFLPTCRPPLVET